MRLGHSLASLWVLGISVAAVAPPRSAHAEPAVPVLVLPTQLGGGLPDRSGWQREFDARMERAIARAGRAPRAAGPLNAADAACRDAECMARLAEGSDVNIVLGLKVTADRGSPPSYKLVMTRYDRDRPGAVRQEDAECTVCTEVQTAERVEHLVALLLPSLVVVPPRPVDPERRYPLPHRPSPAPLYAIMGVTAALGAGGLAMLGVGGYALSIDGDPTTPAIPPSRQAPELYDTKAAGTGLVVTGALLVVGSAIGLGLEGWTLRRRSR